MTSRSRQTRVVEVVESAIAEILRGKSPAERIEMVSAAHRTARRLVQAGVKHQHPDWTPIEIEAEVKRRLAGGTS